MADLGIVAAEVLRNDAPLLEPRYAGVALQAGDVVYLDTDDLYQLARADTTVEASRVVGMVLHASSANTLAMVAYAQEIIVGATAAPEPGAIYCLSQTPGKVTDWTNLVSGDWVTRVGLGWTATTLYLAILSSGEQIP